MLSTRRRQALRRAASLCSARAALTRTRRSRGSRASRPARGRAQLSPPPPAAPRLVSAAALCDRLAARLRRRLPLRLLYEYSARGAERARRLVDALCPRLLLMHLRLLRVCPPHTRHDARQPSVYQRRSLRLRVVLTFGLATRIC